MQIFDRPIFESPGNLDTPKVPVNLTFQFLYADAFLTAFPVPVSRTMVVNVVKELCSGHFVDWSFTTGAGGVGSVGKFFATVAANDLMLFFSSDHRSAFTTADHSRERELMMRLWPRTSVSSEEHLHPVILHLSDHWLMLALVPSAASFGILEDPEIKGLRENLINRTSGHRFTTHLTSRPCSKAPFVVRHVENSWRGIYSSEHEVPDAPDDRKPLRIFDESVLARLLVRVVQISDRSDTRIPSVLNFSLQAALHVSAQIVNILLSHAELDIHEDDVVILTSIALRGCHHFDAMLLDGPDDGTTVHGIACQPIKLPADDPEGLAPVNTLHHCVEHWATGFLGRL